MLNFVTNGRGADIALRFCALAVAVCYWPGISGAATSPRWALLAIIVAVALIIGDQLKATVAHAVGVVFVVWALASVWWSAVPLDTVGASWKLIVLASAFCIGAKVDDLRSVYVGAVMGLAVSSVIAIAQWLGYQPLPDLEVGNAAGLFVNRLILAETAALIGVALIATRMWRWLPAILPSLLLPGERGPVLAFGLVGALALWRASKGAAMALAIGVLVFISAITAQNNQRVGSAQERVTLAQSTVKAVGVLGYGLGSYRESAPQPIEGARVEHGHNEFLEIAFELGWVGVLLCLGFFGIVVVAAGAADKADGRLFTASTCVVLAVMVESVFAFPLHEPATGAIGLLCAGHCVRAMPRARDSFAGSGIRLRRWLASCRRLLAIDGKSHARGRIVSVRSSLP